MRKVGVVVLAALGQAAIVSAVFMKDGLGDALFIGGCMTVADAFFLLVLEATSDPKKRS